ncbi:MAG: metal ABC transporter permease [Candidatus Hodarchaeales archaeon]
MSDYLNAGYSFLFNFERMEVQLNIDLTAFWRYLEYPFLQQALVAAVFIGIICALIGSFVLLRGMVFLGQAIAHSAFAGAALAILIGVDPLIVIIIFSALSAVGIGYVNEKKVMKEEIIIGIVFSFFPALAILFISLYDVYSTDVNSILFGNILIISSSTFKLLVLFSLIVIISVIGLKKEFYFLTFDEEAAKISGLPVRLLNYAFLILVSVTISVSLRAIGAILVFAMIVTPAAAAYQWTFRFNHLLVIAGIFGVFSTVGGLYLSVTLDIPSSSAIVTLVTLIFVISFILSPKRRQASINQLPVECKYCSEYLSADGFCEDPDCLQANTPHYHAIDNDEGQKGEVVIDKRKITDKEPSIHEHEHEHDHD